MPEWIKRATLVSGTSFTGVYAKDGSFNIIQSDGRGVYHKCGAYNVTVFPGSGEHPVYAPDGSLFVSSEVWSDSYKPVESLGTDLLGYWDSKEFSTLTMGSGGAVSSWRDLVAGYDAVQATGAAQPIYGASSFGGDPGVTFDGTDDCLTLAPSPFPTGATPWNIWTLSASSAVDATTRYVVGAGSAFGRRAIYRDTTDRPIGSVGDGTQNKFSIFAGSFAGRSVSRLVTTSVDFTLWFNGVAGPTTAIVPLTTSPRIRFGANGETAASAFWQGQIAAILVTKPLATDKASALQEWLMGRRNI